ncbi:MAG: hypothetical protein M1831_003626 [Alyxoria varia]|nr:MAG: hypothetical protein M1831_003626 [Alyxoria varia]
MASPPSSLSPNYSSQNLPGDSLGEQNISADGNETHAIPQQSLSQNAEDARPSDDAPQYLPPLSSHQPYINFTPSNVAHEGNGYDDDDDDELDPEFRPSSLRWQGSKSKWRRLTQNDRILIDSLDRLENDDLSAHLYNTHAIKRQAYTKRKYIHLKSAVSSSSAQQGNENATEEGVKVRAQTLSKDLWAKLYKRRGDEWLPSVGWSAWPLPPEEVPKDYERWGVLQDWEDDWRVSRKPRTRKEEKNRVRAYWPSEEMEKILKGMMMGMARGELRTMKGRQQEEKEENEYGESSKKKRKLDRSDTGYGTSEVGQGPDEEALLSRMEPANEHGSHPEREQTGPQANTERRPSTPTPPPSAENDDHSDDLNLSPGLLSPSAPLDDSDTDWGTTAHSLKPPIRCTLHKLDHLLTALHTSRLNHEPGYYPFDSDRPRSRSRSSVSRSRSRVRPANSRSPRRAPSAGPTTGTTTGADGTEDDEQGARRGRSSRSRSLFSNSSRAPSSIASFNQRYSKHARPRPRDWSEVLGTAALIGWDADVVKRAAQRCENLLGERMEFRTLREEDVAAPTDAYDGSDDVNAPDTSAPPSHPGLKGPADGANDDIPTTTTTARCSKSKTKRSPPSHTQQAVANATTFFGLQCPEPTCPQRHNQRFKRRNAWLAHIRSAHGYEYEGPETWAPRAPVVTSRKAVEGMRTVSEGVGGRGSDRGDGAGAGAGARGGPKKAKRGGLFARFGDQEHQKEGLLYDDARRKVFRCPVRTCGYSFSEPRSLRRHVKTMHNMHQPEKRAASSNERKRPRAGQSSSSSQSHSSPAMDQSSAAQTRRHGSDSDHENESEGGNDSGKGSDSERESENENESENGRKSKIQKRNHTANATPFTRGADTFLRPIDPKKLGSLRNFKRLVTSLRRKRERAEGGDEENVNSDDESEEDGESNDESEDDVNMEEDGDEDDEGVDVEEEDDRGEEDDARVEPGMRRMRQKM